jgi:hypothetical protein
MAITQLQAPANYTPASNSQRWVASSNQTAQPNFVYTVVVTDAITSTPRTYQIPPDPTTGQCVFDAQPFVERFMVHYLPINIYGWQRIAGGHRQITVNIGETYGATPVYHIGANQSYKVWNGVIDYLEYPDYDFNNYVYDARTQKFTYLSSLLDCYTYPNKSDYLYALTSQVGDILKVRIETYDSTGSLVGEFDIDNPYQGSATYTDKYLAIDIGYKGLNNIPNPQVTVVSGSLPITTNMASYKVYDISVSVTPAQSNVTLLKTVTVGCEPKFEAVTLHYLRKNGAFETINFSMRSDETISTTRMTYKKIPFVHTAGVSSYSRSTATEQQLDSTTKKTLKLRTDWLSPEAIAVHQEILDSGVIYLDDSSAYSYPQLRCLQSTYKITKRSDGLKNIELDFEYAHENHRQR